MNTNYIAIVNPSPDTMPVEVYPEAVKAKDIHEAKELAAQGYGTADVPVIFQLDEGVQLSDQTTEQVVIQMLTENTGRSITDSGDYYGRSWQRNQTRDLASEPVVKMDASVYKYGKDPALGGELDVSVTVSLYHWMTNYLEFDPKWQAVLDNYDVDTGGTAAPLALAEDFAEYLESYLGVGIEPAFNTYNVDSLLSQVVQYIPVRLEGGYEASHLILSVHGGCDVRSGYTMPKVFRIKGEYYELFDGMLEYEFYQPDLGWVWSTSRSIRPSDQYNVTNVPEDLDRADALFKLPAFDTDMLLSLAPDCVQYTIKAEGTFIDNLKDLILTPEQQEKAAEAIKRNTADLRDRTVWSQLQDRIEELGHVLFVTEDSRVLLCGHKETTAAEHIEDYLEIDVSSQIDY